MREMSSEFIQNLNQVLVLIINNLQPRIEIVVPREYINRVHLVCKPLNAKHCFATLAILNSQIKLQFVLRSCEIVFIIVMVTDELRMHRS